MKNRQKKGVFAAIRAAAGEYRLLTVGTLLCVAASVAASLLPPLVLARIIDRLTGGLPLSLLAALLYFGSLALEGILSSAQESLLVLFGQKMTHALRREMSQKLTQLPVATLVDQNPGEVAGRFSGDVDAVEALFTSGIISMVADACRILSILGVIAVKNTGLALVLLLVLPLLAVFTRHVQKRMLAAQLDHRHAVAAVSGQVPETLHNIRTIHALGLEDYMERRYERRIGDSYAAVERTNFYDAVYSPVVLLGLYRPEAGTVTIGGVDASAIPDRQRRICIGCVEQHFSRIPGTVLEQITLCDPQITGEMAEEAARLAGIDEAIQALPEGYDTVCTDGIFSQGEWQLLSIARAAAADPAVLLLDEITANLDAETEARVREALRQASRGRTVLSVSHRIYESLGGRTVEIRPQGQ